jgi:hypothetical protein
MKGGENNCRYYLGKASTPQEDEESLSISRGPSKFQITLDPVLFANATFVRRGLLDFVVFESNKRVVGITLGMVFCQELKRFIPSVLGHKPTRALGNHP